ncbi:two-component system response regulator RssB [Xenorhabdus hominickii]|uniref:Regulator of RpoS n=1 Tax=Xenorhabdus hominickii TaxID=351679 RepID=A0A2G0Q4R4_XENHO|nr:two-component system response regulator RssB [Xenorhabdus hominickii]AOM40145.1 response regulator of RpoS [Xenorhabdus hominickii]PHM54214.1 two-component response regulator [Xenorhabdus hominickii]
MEKVLKGKRILVVEDESVFGSSIVGYLNSLGAITASASNGRVALQKVEEEMEPELIFCDLDMPIMNGLEFIHNMANKGLAIPIIIVSATNKMMEIDNALRLGATDILLKPIANFNEIKKIALNYLYPKLFSSELIERSQLRQEFMVLKHNTSTIWGLLKQLQPPVSQVIANCRINYRLLNIAGKTGLVFDIAALSEKEMIFYCLDASHSKDKSASSALLLRVAFNHLLKKKKFNKNNELIDLRNITNWLNRILNNEDAAEPLPLLLGYYDTCNKTILLSSTGLNAHIQSGNQQKQLDRRASFGTLKVKHLRHIVEQNSFWQCRVWNSRNQIKLIFSPLSCQ